MKVKFTTLTTQFAAKLLETTEKGNRRVSSAAVERYAEDIRKGRWSDNGVPIILNGDGKMLDGQHRCLAVMRANRDIPIMIVSGVMDKNAFATIDTGRNRKLTDMLSIRGEKSCAMLAGALTLLNEYEHKTDAGFTRWKVTNQAGLSLLRSHSGLRDSVSFSEACRKNMAKGMIRPTVMIVTHYLGAQIRVRKTEEFIDTLSTGVGLAKGSPVLVLRNKLIRGIKSEGFTSREEQLAWCIKAWNAYAVNERMQVLRWARGGAEPYPSFKKL